MRSRHTLAAIATLAVLVASLATHSACGPLPAPPGGAEPARRSAAITDGEVVADPPVVALVIGPDDALQLCTATLVGPRTVLTAAHCILPDLRYRIYVGGQERPQATMVRHPDYRDGDITYAHDLGLISLVDAVADVTPVRLGLLLEPQPGMPVTLVGYGATAAGQSPTGELRRATNAISSVTPESFWINGTGNGSGNICASDSGGPAFADVGAGDAAQRVQLGVASMGTTPCGLLGRFARLDRYREWLVAAAGGDLPAPDAAPQVKILEPLDGDEVRSPFDLALTARDDHAVVALRVLVDGLEVVAEALAAERTPPYVFPLTLAAGEHEITATARDDAGQEASDRVTLTVVAPPAPAPPPPPDPEPDPATAPSDPAAGSGGCAAIPAATAPGGPCWLALLPLLRARRRAKRPC